MPYGSIVVRTWTSSFLALAAAAVLVVAPAAPARAAALDSVTTTVLSTVPDELAFDLYQHPRPWAPASAAAGTPVLVPADPLPTTLRGHELFVAPSGLAIAVVTTRAGERTLAIDGVAQEGYRHVEAFRFSGLGRHFAFVERDGGAGRVTVVADGTEFALEPLQELVSGPFLSPDGGRWACVIRERNELFVKTADGLAGPYQEVRALAFSRDGRRLGITARVRERWVVFVDGQAIGSGDEAGPVRFDPSGRHVATPIRGGSFWHVMRDGVLGDGYGAIDANSLMFSRDGSRLGFATRSPSATACVVLDGRPGREWIDVATDSSLFSPDGRRSACWVMPARTTWRLMVDDTVVTSDLSEPGTATFSEDGRHLAFTEWVGRRGPWRVVVDGQPGPLYDAVGAPRLVGAGPRLIHSARTGRCQRVVVDGVPGPCFEQVGEPAASPDGRHVAYTAAEPGPRAWMVVDGVRGPTFEAILSARPAFLPDGGLQYFAVSRSELLLVRHAARPATR